MSCISGHGGQKNAARLAHGLYGKGYLVLKLSPANVVDDPERWNVETGTTLSVERVVDEAFVTALVTLAESVDGEFDRLDLSSTLVGKMMWDESKGWPFLTIILARKG